MGEREGTQRDFLNLLGRSPGPEQEAEPKPDETSEETPEPAGEDPLLAALRGEDEWAKKFVDMLHPPEEKP